MLNVAIQSAFKDHPRHTPYWVVILEPAAYIWVRELCERCGYESLDVRPQNVELRGFAGLVLVIAIDLDDVLSPSLPFLELAFVLCYVVEAVLYVHDVIAANLEEDADTTPSRRDWRTIEI